MFACFNPGLADHVVGIFIIIKVQVLSKLIKAVSRHDLLYIHVGNSKDFIFGPEQCEGQTTLVFPHGLYCATLDQVSG